MAWSDSRAFRQFVADMATNTAAFNLTADSIKGALFNNSITPDNDVTAANSAYNAGQWATANEVFEAIQWPQGGIALANKVINIATADVVMFDADNLQSGTAATLSAYGIQIYDDTLAAPVADQGISYNFFGGNVAVVAGQLTVAWHASGIVRWTL